MECLRGGDERRLFVDKGGPFENGWFGSETHCRTQKALLNSDLEGLIQEPDFLS
jgi:hypothetical protein